MTLQTAPARPVGSRAADAVVKAIETRIAALAALRESPSDAAPKPLRIGCYAATLPWLGAGSVRAQEGSIKIAQSTALSGPP